MKKSVVVFLTFIELSAFAQTTIKGKVVDASSGIGEVAAVVQVFEQASDSPFTYTITDSLGVFNLRTNKSGGLKLSIENMGRKTVERTFTANGGIVDLGDIPIEDDIQALKGATASALRTLVKVDVDKTTYDVAGDVDAKANTVLEMLRKVPMVTVDGQDNITVNGSSSFKVYVDGKPNQMLSSNASQIFKVMPASSVKSIEVITNPGAKYDAEGTGGVLNLITAAASSKAVADGVYGSVSASVDTRGSLKGGLFLNAQKGKWGFGANLNGGRDVNEVDYLVEQTSNDMEYTQTKDIDSKNPMLFGELSASYELDTLNLFTASMGIQRFGNNNLSTGLFEAFTNGTSVYSYSDETDNKWRYSGLEASFDYQHSFPNAKDKMLTLSYRYSGEPSTSDATETITSLTGDTIPSWKTEQDDNTQEHTFQADYTTPISDNQELSTGLKYIFRHNSADDDYYLASGNDWLLSETNSSDYDHYNHIGAAYAEYSGSFGKFGLKAGLRYEHTWQSMNFHDGSSDNFDVQYGNLVPNISLQWNLSQTSNIGIAYNMRIRRPGINYLNPFVEQSTPTNISYGNPDLDAERRQRFNIIYNSFSPKFVISAKLGLNYCGNGIENYSFSKDGIRYSTYGNIVKNYDLGGNVFINWNATPKTRIYANTSAAYSHWKSEELDQENGGWSINGMLGAQQTLPKNFTISGNIFGGSKNYSLQGYNSGMAIGVLSISKSFLEDKLSLTLRGVSNLTSGKMEIFSHSEGNGFTYDNTMKIPIRHLSFEIQYKFGKQGISVKKAKRTIENDDVMGGASSSSSSTSSATSSATSAATSM